MNKLITILGPTASGKSALGIKLAQELARRGGGFKGEPASPAGEIVSADSRQVYRGLDIGAGKVTADEQKSVPHHLLDIVDPMADFSVAHFQKLAFGAIDDIIKRGQLPFLVGGTALYIYSVVDNYNLSAAGANSGRRKELEKKTVEELQNILSGASPLARGRLGLPSVALAKEGGGLNSSDFRNPRRLIRAIEKLEAGVALSVAKNPPRYDSLLLGINIPRDELYKKIDRRVDERLKQGMIEEVKNLIDEWPPATRSRLSSVASAKEDGEGWLIGLGLEYRFITEYLQGKHSKDETIKRLKGAIHAFARRQLTWWKRDKRIVWIKNLDQARQQVKNFLE